MGQYYRPIVFENTDQLGCFCLGNLEPIASLTSYGYDNGAKIIEHAYVGNYFVNAAMVLLADDIEGTFKGHYFAWMGDYGDDEEQGFYDKAREIDSSEAVSKLLEKKGIELEDVHYRYILNCTDGQYVEVPEDNGKLQLHPLPILTAVGNGESMSDYYGTDMDMVGAWAFCEIVCTNEKPDDEVWERIEVNFTEKR